MKNKKNLFKTLTAAFLALTCALSACGTDGGNNSGNSGDGGVKDDEARSVVKDTFNGTHVFTATDTEIPFVSNGGCLYSVVIPKDAKSQLNTAKNELITFFAEATGITLTVYNDEEFTDEGTGYISLGETKQLAEAGIEADKQKLTSDGARIITKGKNVYIFGGAESGTLYGVYDFLEIYFDFDVYYKDCYKINKNVKNLNLKNFDVTDVPDLEYRSNGYYRLITGDWANRFRMPGTYGTITFPVYEDVTDMSSSARSVHNSLNWLPTAQYLKSNPLWYNNSGSELCYTAHGDPEQYKLMLAECAKKAIATLKIFDREQYPEIRILNFTQQDNAIPCDCSECVKNEAIYGSKAANLILFMNDLRAEIDEQMANLDEKYRRNDLTLTFFAYQVTENAPADVPAMHLNDGVSVFLATSSSFDHQAWIYADSNTEGRVNLKNWGKLSKEILLWTYSTKFSHYMYPVDTFNFYSEDAYTFFAANNVKLMYNQSQVTQQGTATAWHNLKAYLDSKLEWDGARDAKQLTDKYMEAMFGEAASIMSEIYTDVRLQSAVVKSKYNGKTLLANVTDLQRADFWPYLTLKQWLNKYEKAYAALEVYRNADPAAYALYKGHIDAEWLSPAYMTLALYSSSLSEKESADLKQKFRAAVEATGITNVRETGSNQMAAFVDSL